MNVHFLVHEWFEAPGAFEGWAASRGHHSSYSRLYDGDPLPVGAAAIDLLVVMGGPQSPATMETECPHFHSAAEQTLIRTFVDYGKAVVGVCLGAQLIGDALGASFVRSPEPEIGKFPIFLTADGLADRRFEGFGDRLDVGHWHNDMPGLTPDCRIIAASDGCPRQIVAYGDLVYGFQCHMEFTSDLIEGLISRSAQDLANGRGRRYVQQAEALRAEDWTAMNAKLFLFLDRLAADYARRGTLSEQVPGPQAASIA